VTPINGPAMTEDAPPNWEEAPPNWKLLLRYGRLTTPYEHFTVIVDVQVTEADVDAGSHVGPAWMGMKVWAPSEYAAAEIISDIAPRVGAKVRGKFQVYKTEPEEPPQGMPFAYDLRFTPYKA
jgi:hypothetical protein